MGGESGSKNDSAAHAAIFQQYFPGVRSQFFLQEGLKAAFLI
jgi:hypothetical protein